MKRSYLLSVTLCVCLFVPQMFAQSTQATSTSPQAPNGSEGWRLRLIPYLWGPNMDGRIGIDNRSVDVDARFLDILKELNFAFMAAFEADRDRFTTTVDSIYMNLSDSHATPGPLFSGAKAINKSFILTPEAGYRLIGSDTAFVDVQGGIRFWHVNGELKFEPGILPGIGISKSRNWVDGIFALKGRHHLAKSWDLTGYGDIGGGGSNLTYQIIGAASTDIGKHYALVLGYRYLNVDYNKDQFLFDIGMGGPVIGFTFKF